MTGRLGEYAITSGLPRYRFNRASGIELYSTVRGNGVKPKLVARAGEVADLPFSVHPHMLRHSAGYKLANDGQDTRAIQHYLEHRNIQHTVRYTELSPERFQNFWKD